MKNIFNFFNKKVEGSKKCPHCLKEVDIKASKCPHCHGKIYVWTTTRKLLVVLIPIIIFVIISGSSDSTPSTTALTPERIISLKESSIRSLSKDYVSNILKSPSTAKFNKIPVIKQDEKDPNLFEIISHVDSENSFGAMIRNEWSIKVRYVGVDTEDAIYTGQNYKIEEFYFDGEKVK